MKHAVALGLALTLLGAAACGDTQEPASKPLPPPKEPPVVPPPRFDVVEPGEDKPGGDTSVARPGPTAFTQPAANLSLSRRAEFFVGESVFEADWVPAPGTQPERDGLGPVFHSVSCLACHLGNGRGRPPEENEVADTLLVRLSVPGTGPHGEPVPEPTYGDQLQPRGVRQVPAEGQARMTWREVSGTFADGAPYSLREPRLELTNLAFGPLSPDTRTSARIAQPMVGLGLLAAIPNETLVEWADPDDTNGDGVSGRPNRVWNQRLGHVTLGRFGWKANQPDLEHQNAAAFLGDLGLTTSLFPQENCTAAQATCQTTPNGGGPEVSERQRLSLDFYSHTVAVPTREGVDSPQVLQGKGVFHRVGCARCHRPSVTTGTLEGYPELSGQRIWPYSDLLLHDMGEALADGREDFFANGREWRTAPLWGLGRTQTVSGHTSLLHDGRARTPMEAILWHGGEAHASKEAVRALPKAEREALLAFLGSL